MAELKRSISLPLLIFYGLGTMVGGGFYALLGEIAGEAGLHTPIAFAFSGLLAAVSAMSFAELSSRFPVSAGEVQYVQEGFNKRAFSILVGWMVIATGVVSAATLSVATVGFLRDFLSLPHAIGVAGLVAAMGVVAIWGVSESVGIVAVITVIEVGALLVAAFLLRDSLGTVPERWNEFTPIGGGALWTGIFTGAFVAFYGYIGFEDMVNMAEEVKEPRRNLPIAILVAVGVTTILYVVVSFLAVATVSPEALNASNTPMAEVVRDHGWFSTTGMGVVSILTGINGALVQIVMASRVAYGMAQREQAPSWLGIVHPTTQTPLRGTLAITGVVLVLALLVPLTTLAKITSGIILVIFASVNLALWRIKKRAPDAEDEGVIHFPRWAPLLGFVVCVGVLLFQAWITITGGR